MGFWEQLDYDSADRRRSRLRPRSNPPPVNKTVRRVPEAYHDSFAEEAQRFGKQEKTLPEWDMADVTQLHPEWGNDPDLLEGYELARRLDFEAIEKFGQALEHGNWLAAIAVGDLFTTSFCILTQWKRYRIGSDEYMDSMVKMALSGYLIAMFEESLMETVLQRIKVLHDYCTPEEKLKSMMEEVTELVAQFGREHPEMFLKQCWKQ